MFGRFEYAPYTALTVVQKIDVSIDCNCNKVSNHIKGKLYSIEDEDNNVLCLCFVLKINCVQR